MNCNVWGGSFLSFSGSRFKHTLTFVERNKGLTVLLPPPVLSITIQLKLISRSLF